MIDRVSENSSSPPATVLVVDDDPFVRSALGGIVREAEGLELAGLAENGLQGVEAAAQLRPDLVLMDLEMPVMAGAEATRRICDAENAPKVVILTVRAGDEDVVATMRAGAAGFLLKNSAPAEIVTALRHAAEGEAVLSPEVTRLMIEAFVEREPPRTKDDSAWESLLTEREVHVARAVAQGKSNQQIANELFMTVSTAKTNVSRILMKLGLENRVQVALAVNGIIDGPTI